MGCQGYPAPQNCVLPQTLHYVKEQGPCSLLTMARTTLYHTALRPGSQNSADFGVLG